MFLCLDTSHGASVAVLSGTGVLARAATDDPRQHAEALTPLIARALGEACADTADLTGIVVGTGPAPFTGLRVGLITARTLGFSLGIPSYGVPALAAIARGVFDAEPLGRVRVVTDARRREVYTAEYSPDGADDVAEVSAPAVVRPADLAPTLGAVAVRGRGVELYPEHFEGRAHDLDPACLGRIAHARLARARAAGTDPDLPTDPLYLRRPDIHPGAGRKRAT